MMMKRFKFDVLYLSGVHFSIKYNILVAVAISRYSKHCDIKSYFVLLSKIPSLILPVSCQQSEFSRFNLSTNMYKTAQY